MDVYKLINRVAGGGKGNITRVNFSVEDRNFEAYVPDDEYWGSIKDVILDREYEYLPGFELINFRGKRIVDAGAHVGLFSLVASNFASEVISIEAHPVNFRLLEVNLLKNRVRNVIPLNKALVGVKREVKIYEGGHSGGHSILISRKVGRSILSDSSGYAVDPITLEEVVKEYGEIDLLKIDIEGAEFEVFENTSTNVLRRVDNIVGEVHLNYGNFERLKKVLERLFYVKAFHSPLIKNYSYLDKVKISIDGFKKLKVARKVIYSLSRALNLKNKSLLILFAWRR